MKKMKKSEIQLLVFNREKKLAIFLRKIEIRERCKGVHCVDLGESFPTNITCKNRRRYSRERALRKPYLIPPYRPLPPLSNQPWILVKGLRSEQLFFGPVERKEDSGVHECPALGQRLLARQTQQIRRRDDLPGPRLEPATALSRRRPSSRRKQKLDNFRSWGRRFADRI